MQTVQKGIFTKNNTIFIWINKTYSVSYADSSLKEGAFFADLFEGGGTERSEVTEGVLLNLVFHMFVSFCTVCIPNSKKLQTELMNNE